MVGIQRQNNIATGSAYAYLKTSSLIATLPG